MVHLGGGNGNMPEGFLERTALRREQCIMLPKIQNLGITEIYERHPLLGNVMAKHEFEATDMPATAEVLLSSALSSQSEAR